MGGGSSGSGRQEDEAEDEEEAARDEGSVTSRLSMMELTERMFIIRNYSV